MSARASGYIKALTVCPNGELISAREKLVAMVLADSHQDRARRFTFPSVDTIAEEARCDRRSCQRFLAALERKGVIRRLRPSNQGAGMHTFYFFPALDEIPEGWQDAALFEFAHEKGRAAKGRVKGREKGGSLPPLHNSTRAREVTVTEATEANTPPQPPSRGEGGEAAMDSDDRGMAKPDKTLASDAHSAGSVLSADAVTPRACRTTGREQVAGKSRKPRGDAAGPAVGMAIETVMLMCGFVAKRLRGPVRAVIELEADKGIHPNTTALAMSAAWKDYEAAKPRLRWSYGGPKRFFEDGAWRNRDAWPWEKPHKAELEMQRLRASEGMAYQMN